MIICSACPVLSECPEKSDCTRSHGNKDVMLWRKAECTVRFGVKGLKNLRWQDRFHRQLSDRHSQRKLCLFDHKRKENSGFNKVQKQQVIQHPKFKRFCQWVLDNLLTELCCPDTNFCTSLQFVIEMCIFVLQC